ncbi:MAG: sigma-54-dependent Fis family transcriptional regulator [Nitrospirae bacterium]|jgi:two-component system, NtrC family, response regulator GlrR|nr:sigma-54-dependent Fis family transcriptional regulator [Nitrospirota bacterium]
MPKQKILIVDDDLNLLELLKVRLESADYEVVATSREEDAVRAVQQQTPALSIVDLQLVQQDGISLMEELHKINPEMPVIILTAYGSIESAVEAMRRGAYNYLTKPFEPRELLFQVENAIENQRLTNEIKRLKGLIQEQYDFKNIVAKSKKMQKVLEQVARVAETDSTIFIYGESGTGKELIAKAIHLASDRKEKPFIPINCAAIPETLLESELFGYEKGSFTGALKSSKGLLVQAHEGTIFLDEIGDMPLSMQIKLLRFLQERQLYHIGGQNPIEVDVRVIVATNKNLSDMVKEARFREDLFYRIHVIPIHIPPLRERKEDIPLLAEHFLKTFNQQMKKEVNGLVPLAMQKLMLYDWPGNVRELENIIEYAVAMTKHNLITEDLILIAKSSELLKPLKESKDNFEKIYLINVLELTKGNVSKAAKLAGKYRADFYNLLKKYGIMPENFKNYKKD